MNTESPRKKCEGPYVCSLKFLKKSVCITRREHGNALARPKPIRLKPFPDPKLIRELPLKIEYGTMHGKVPPRTEVLAQPKRRPPVEIKKPIVNKQPYSGGKSQYSVSRMLELSRPKIHVIRHKAYMKTEENGNVRFKQNKLYSNMTESEQRRFRMEWLARNALPKVRTRLVAKTNEKRLTRKQQEESNERLTRVSDLKRERMTRKPYVRPTEPRPPGGKLEPLPFPWVNRLSQPKKLLTEAILDIEYNPYLISKAALNATPTKRILELSQPKHYVTKTDLLTKADPFAVNPRALKYKATKRIKMLAKPRIRA